LAAGSCGVVVVKKAKHHKAKAKQSAVRKMIVSTPEHKIVVRCCFLSLSAICYSVPASAVCLVVRNGFVFPRQFPIFQHLRCSS